MPAAPEGLSWGRFFIQSLVSCPEILPHSIGLSFFQGSYDKTLEVLGRVSLVWQVGTEAQRNDVAYICPGRVAVINSQSMAVGRHCPSLIRGYGASHLPSETRAPRSRWQEGTRRKMKPPVAAATRAPCKANQCCEGLWSRRVKALLWMGPVRGLSEVPRGQEQISQLPRCPGLS